MINVSILSGYENFREDLYIQKKRIMHTQSILYEMNIDSQLVFGSSLNSKV